MREVLMSELVEHLWEDFDAKFARLQHYGYHYIQLRIVVIAPDGKLTTRVYKLDPHKETKIMTSVVVGHQIAYSMSVVDANGNAPPAGQSFPITSPSWTDVPVAPPGVDTFTQSADGTTALLVATAVGTDTVTATGTVGTAVFTATDVVTIAAVFVPAGIKINAVVT
jgi:hypothetical protein